MQASGDKSTGEPASPPSGSCCQTEKVPIPVELEDGRTPRPDHFSPRTVCRHALCLHAHPFPRMTFPTKDVIFVGSVR